MLLAMFMAITKIYERLKQSNLPMSSGDEAFVKNMNSLKPTRRVHFILSVL